MYENLHIAEHSCYRVVVQWLDCSPVRQESIGWFNTGEKRGAAVYWTNVAPPQWTWHKLHLTSGTAELSGKVVRLYLSQKWELMATLMGICRVVQASHITPLLFAQQWWVPGGTRKLNCNMIDTAAAKCTNADSPQRRWDCVRESFYTRGVSCKICWTPWGCQTVSRDVYIYISLYHFYLNFLWEHYTQLIWPDWKGWFWVH